MLIDTSGLLCLIDRREAQRPAAETYFGAASSRLLHNYVLAEFIALAQSRGVPRKAALDFANDLEASDEVELVWVLPELHSRAMDLLASRLDKEWSLCDAISMVLMKDRGMREALTTDHHFEQAGFVRLLK